MAEKGTNTARLTAKECAALLNYIHHDVEPDDPSSKAVMTRALSKLQIQYEMHTGVNPWTGQESKRSKWMRWNDGGPEPAEVERSPIVEELHNPPPKPPRPLKVHAVKRGLSFHEIRRGDRVRLLIDEENADYIDVVVYEHEKNRLDITSASGYLIVQPHSSNRLQVGRETYYEAHERRQGITLDRVAELTDKWLEKMNAEDSGLYQDGVRSCMNDLMGILHVNEKD